jgi:hypothetical protein
MRKFCDLIGIVRNALPKLLRESKFPRRKRMGYGTCFARKPTVFIATLIFSLRAEGNLPDRD